MSFKDRFLSNSKQKAQTFSINDPAFFEFLRSGETSTKISTEQAVRISTVFTCVKIIAETIASMDCSLFKIDGDSKTIQTDNRLHKVVNRNPNDFMTAPEFWSFVVMNLLIHGEAFAYITRTTDARPVELLPIKWENVSVQVQAQNRITYQVTLGVDGKEKTLPLSMANILHFKGLTLDGIRGVNPIQYNAQTLNHAIHARDFASNVFTNSATPRGILTTEGELGDDAYENIKNSWNDAHLGVDNSSRIAILEGGLDFRQISMSPEDVQLLESRKLSRSEIAGMYRVPPHMVAEMDRATFNNIEHQSLQFFTNTILPWVKFIVARLNFQLLSTTTQEFKFDNSPLILGSFVDQVDGFTKLVDRGIYNPNEVRRRFGENPREGGDEYVVQSNNLTFGNDSDEEKPKPGDQQPTEETDPDAVQDI